MRPSFDALTSLSLLAQLGLDVDRAQRLFMFPVCIFCVQVPHFHLMQALDCDGGETHGSAIFSSSTVHGCQYATSKAFILGMSSPSRRLFVSVSW